MMSKIISKPIFWIFFCSFMFFTPIVKSVMRELPKPPEAIYPLPDFNLIDENGVSFRLEHLKGKVAVFSFIFTSCPSSCLRISEKMQKIQKRVRGLGQNIALISVTVDPTVDTSDVLFRYARHLKANPYVWKFLTGDEEKIKSFVIHGFKLALSDKNSELRAKIPTETGSNEINYMDIAHSEKLVLVDQKGMIRSYYGLDDNSMNKMMVDVGILVNSRM
jgi:protein SCO1/2